MTEPRTITDPAVLAMLANPARTRLLDVLRADGPATASRLAEQTGLAVGSVSHHMKVLASAGFVREAPERARDRRERWWELVIGSWQWSRGELAAGPANDAIATAAEAVVLSRQAGLARDWLDRAESGSEWERAAFATQTWLRLSSAELRELGAEITALYGKWGARELPEDGIERERVFAFARAFPATP